METINIIPSESKLWEQAWRLYTESFPEHERRRISSHRRAVEDPCFHTRVAVENGNLLGILFYWNFGKENIYIEHMAVNPLRRGQNIGTAILGSFIAQNPHSNIVLEIAPPVDDDSRRRMTFYKKLGFIVNDFAYTHPSYQKKGLAYELVILSFPTPVTDGGYEEFCEFMKSSVLRYID